jgi:hypothetical protein
MKITLNGPQITALSQQLSAEPLTRAATRERAAKRFTRLLAARTGLDSADNLARGILDAPDEAAAQARLAGALRPFAAAAEPAPAATAAAEPAPAAAAAAEPAPAAAAAAEPAPAPAAPAKASPPIKGESPEALRQAIAEGRVRSTAKRLRLIAEAGILPPPPDFSAETHARFREPLCEVIRLAGAGDVAGLQAFEIKAISSSPRAILRYRDAALIALAAGA